MAQDRLQMTLLNAAGDRVRRERVLAALVDRNPGDSEAGVLSRSPGHPTGVG
jgi:hypothetical protein